jgi:SIR2-like domain
MRSEPTMTLLGDDPHTQLAFSVYENKGVFAVLLGSGLSRAAEIPTGWEITIDLIRRVALAQGVSDQPDWATWYRQTTRQEPNYSALLQELAASPSERRSILQGYIEPTETDREEGRKVPTAAHYALADLVCSGYIRVIITTNFDRLIENALHERGVEPTIVASVDALAGAEPIIHSSCYILKLHGDYRDARILNTDAELTAYPAEYDALLDRIFDEHGLIVCGWSGEWDIALRAAFMRAPNRRYPVYWAARGWLRAAAAQELVDHRGARIIPITDADSFFKGLRERVETLAQGQRQNPLSTELLVSSAKRYLAKPEHRIQLDELFAHESDRLMARLDGPEFAPQAPWDQEAFRTRVRRYESATESLVRMTGVLGRWGDGSELPIVLDIIRTLYRNAEKVSGGRVVYLNIRSYPAVLVLTAYGIGLTRAERWNALHRLFSAIIDRQDKEPIIAVESLFLWAWKGTENNAWEQIEGLEKRKTPLSDHLLGLLSEWGTSFVGLTPDFELLFERFELLGSLAYLERYEKAEVQAELKSTEGWAWMPVGRSAWNTSYADKIISEMKADPMKGALLKAGFAKSDTEFLDAFIANFERIRSRVRW